MANNEFEQKMREELRQLLIRPSSEVWNQVRAGIEPRKRKKRWIFWIPLGLAILLGGGYLLLPNGRSADKELNTVAQTLRSAESKNQELDKKPLSNSNPEEEKVILSEESKPGKESIDPNSVISLKKSTGVENKSLPIENKRIPNSDQASDIRTVKKNNNKNQRSIEQKEHAESPKRTGYPSHQDLTAKEEPTNQKFFPASGFTPSLVEKKSRLPDSGWMVPSNVLNADSALKEPWNDSILSAVNKPQPLKRTSRKWTFGITGRIGVSGIQNGFNVLPGVNALMTDQVQASNGPTAPGISSSTHYQSEFSWGLGLEVRRELAKNWSLVSGLQYQQYRSSIRIGNRVDSSRNLNYGNYSINLDNYYQAGKTHTFQNKLHYLEWPIMVEFHSGNRLPFYIRTGMTTGFLLGSSLVHEDQQFGIYYQDPDQLRKWQWSMKAGAGISLFHKQKHQLNLGPEFQYFFSNLFNSSVSSNKHIGFTGLAATWKF